MHVFTAKLKCSFCKYKAIAVIIPNSMLCYSSIKSSLLQRSVVFSFVEGNVKTYKFSTVHRIGENVCLNIVQLQKKNVCVVKSMGFGD